MPAYDYRCTACDLTFEVTRKVGDLAEERCPECDSPTKRVFTPVGVVFKGSGFHNTDYRPKPSEGKDSSAGADSKPAPCGADKPASAACGGCPASTD